MSVSNYEGPASRPEYSSSELLNLADYAFRRVERACTDTHRVGR